jgi:excisionase family DNA binding protein
VAATKTKPSTCDGDIHIAGSGLQPRPPKVDLDVPANRADRRAAARPPKMAPLIRDGATVVGGRRAVSVPEAGLILGLGRSTIYTAVVKGIVPSVWVGGRRLVPVTALERLLETDEPVSA